MDKNLDTTRYIAAIKGGKIVYKAEDSRTMADYIMPETKGSRETVARAIRKAVDSDVLYAGYLFVEV